MQIRLFLIRFGTNILGLTNEYGMSLSRDIINLANRGGGFMYSSYDVDSTDSEEIMLLYVDPRGDDWLIGSSMWLPRN